MEKYYTKIDMEETGNRIHHYMIKKGLSVKELQNCLGLSSPQAVYHWIHGRSLPSIDNLYALSGIFQVPLDFIVVGNRQYQPYCDLMLQKLLYYLQYSVCVKQQEHNFEAWKLL